MFYRPIWAGGIKSVSEFSLIQTIIIWAIPVIFAITIHEVAHGWMALKLGDRTAQMLGRLTLNPIKHIDPLGTIIVPGLLLTLGGFVFGWAKPVPVSFQNLNKPKSDMAWVAFAGPFANFLMALFWGLMIKIGLVLLQSDIMIGEPMVYMGVAGVLINAMLMMVNLIPIPPLDGGRILVSWLPEPYSRMVSGVEQYGFFILIALIYFKILYLILWPLIALLLSLISSTYHIPMTVFNILG